MAAEEMERLCAWQQWLASTETELDLAAAQAVVSHDDPDAIAAAQAVALSIFLLRKNVAPRAVRERLTREFRYDIRPERALSSGGFDVSAAGTVPPAFAALFEFPDWEVRFERPSVSAEIPIRLPALPAPWPKPFTACPIKLPRGPARI